MSTTRLAIEAAIKTGFEAASGVQHVIVGNTNFLNPATFKTAYRESDGSDLQLWVIRRVRTGQDTNETNPNVPIRYNILRHYSFSVDGYFSAKNDGTSEAAFQVLLDGIITAFNNRRTLTGWFAYAIQLEMVNEQPLGNVLCHHAQFTIDVDDMISGLSPA
jgi:hypothetical protein